MLKSTVPCKSICYSSCIFFTMEKRISRQLFLTCWKFEDYHVCIYVQFEECHGRITDRTVYDSVLRSVWTTEQPWMLWLDQIVLASTLMIPWLHGSMNTLTMNVINMLQSSTAFEVTNLNSYLLLNLLLIFWTSINDNYDNYKHQ